MDIEAIIQCAKGDLLHPYASNFISLLDCV